MVQELEVEQVVPSGLHVKEVKVQVLLVQVESHVAVMASCSDFLCEALEEESELPLS